MKLAKVYDPLLKLKGYTMWSIDEKHEIMYFYYRIKTPKGTLRLFLYLFLSETYSGVDYIVENGNEMEDSVSDYIHPYRQTAAEVLEKRERLRQLFH